MLRRLRAIIVVGLMVFIAAFKAANGDDREVRGELPVTLEPIIGRPAAIASSRTSGIPSASDGRMKISEVL